VARHLVIAEVDASGFLDAASIAAAGETTADAGHGRHLVGAGRAARASPFGAARRGSADAGAP